MELAVPAHLVRRSSHGIHHEGARSEKTDSDDREKNGSNARGLSVLKLGRDTTRKDEQQQSENNEIGDLNPAAWTERQFTDKHSEWYIARAKPALHREYRHKECRSNHACPCRKSVLIHRCFCQRLRDHVCHARYRGRRFAERATVRDRIVYGTLSGDNQFRGDWLAERVTGAVGGPSSPEEGAPPLFQLGDPYQPRACFA